MLAEGVLDGFVSAETPSAYMEERVPGTPLEKSLTAKFAKNSRKGREETAEDVRMPAIAVGLRTDVAGSSFFGG